jgi:CRISPR-associated protein Csm3
MKLKRIKEIKGKITLKTGLHVGAGDSEMRIGGTDNPVIKHPFTQEPYIPGSSIKGKVRSLLEMKYGLMRVTKGEPVKLEHLKEDKKDKSANSKNLEKFDDNDKKNAEKIMKLFGAGASSDDDLKEIAEKIGPTRVSFADCPLDKDWNKDAKEKHYPLVEVKSENTINRITGTAQHPRFVERVPASAQFEFCVSLKIMEEDQGHGIEELLREGLRLLEQDALGGSGSRGYGRIKFEPEIEEFADTDAP